MKRNTLGRAILKGVTYKLLSLSVAFVVLTVLLGMSLDHALGVASLDTVIRFALYIVHERLWG